MFKRRNLPVFIGIGLLTMGFIVSLFFLRGVLKERLLARANVGTLEQEIARLKQARISSEQINFLKEKNAKLKTNYETHIQPVFNSPALHFSQDKLSIYACIDKALAEESRCREECQGKLQLPVNLGFDEYKENIPSDEESLNLLKRVELFNEVKKLLLDSGVVNLLKLQFHPPGGINTISGDAQTSYRNFPVEIIIEGEFSSLIRFLYNVRSSRHAFLIKNLRVNPSEGWKGSDGRIKIETRQPVENGMVAEILLSTVVFVSPEKG